MDHDPYANGQSNSSGILAISSVKGFSIFQAESQLQIAQARELFLEYAQTLGFSLCFQNFDAELAGLPGDYAPPKGRLLLAECQGQLAGCVALRPKEFDICEMKRLYLRPQFRGKGIGRDLAERVIAEARQIGYARMRLDTVEPVMKDAVAMYRRLGFHEIAPYCDNPMAGTLYMELELGPEPPSTPMTLPGRKP
jgi:putative acetyltransferase